MQALDSSDKLMTEEVGVPLSEQERQILSEQRESLRQKIHFLEWCIVNRKTLDQATVEKANRYLVEISVDLMNAGQISSIKQPG